MGSFMKLYMKYLIVTVFFQVVPLWAAAAGSSLSQNYLDPKKDAAARDAMNKKVTGMLQTQTATTQKVQQQVATTAQTLAATAPQPVPPLPAWVIANPEATPAMPDLTAAELAKSCVFTEKGKSFGNDAQKPNAITFVRKTRYLALLKPYLTRLTNDITKRKAFISQLQSVIDDKQIQINGVPDPAHPGKTIGGLKNLIAADQVLLQNVIAELTLANQNTQAIKAQANESSFIGLTQKVKQGILNDQQQLKDKQAELDKLQASSTSNKVSVQDVAPKIQQTVKLVKYWQAQAPTLQPSLDKLATDIKNAQAQVKQLGDYVNPYGSNPQYAPAIAQYKERLALVQKYLGSYQTAQKTLQQVQVALQFPEVQELLDAVKATSFDVAYAQADVATLKNQLFTQQELRASLLDARDVTAIDKLNTEIKDIKSSMNGQLELLKNGIGELEQNELYLYNLAVANANFFVAQQQYYLKVINTHQDQIKQMSADMTTLVDQIKQISAMISGPINDQIKTTNQLISQLVKDIQTPASGMFDACPRFLQDLLR